MPPRHCVPIAQVSLHRGAQTLFWQVEPGQSLSLEHAEPPPEPPPSTPGWVLQEPAMHCAPLGQLSGEVHWSVHTPPWQAAFWQSASCAQLAPRPARMVSSTKSWQPAAIARASQPQNAIRRIRTSHPTRRRRA